ncbi:MAG: trypsin-like peptidase domain-containing protein [Myxococcales bacterium]|nr:trypsin-like peptidase domain-containing protein [Myxococcales bacterium]
MTVLNLQPLSQASMGSLAAIDGFPDLPGTGEIPAMPEAPSDNQGDTAPQTSQADEDQLVPVGSGSGFFADELGHVITNAHVVDGAQDLMVVLQDGSQLPAEVIGADDMVDVAIVQVDLPSGASVPGVAAFGDSEALRPGEEVVAIGNALGEFPNTVSQGTVNGVDRAFPGMGGLAAFVQHDAEIWHGNSGGPLLNLHGEVVGINTAVGGHDGLGFAVPVDQAKVVVPKLIRDGKVVRGWLGITGSDKAPDFGVMPERGALVSEVRSDTPAAKAGVLVGDRVMKIDGREIADFDELRGRIGEYAPQDRVALELLRAGKVVTVEVELGERPDPAALSRIDGMRRPQPSPTPPATDKDLYQGKPARLGVEVRDEGGELEVVRVVEGGVGHRLGLRAGDRLQEINGQSVRSVAEILAALEGDRSRAAVTVRRGQSTHSSMIDVTK